MLSGWFDLLIQFGGEVRAKVKALEPLGGDQIACLVGLAFLGAKSMILIGMNFPIRDALRAIGDVLQAAEQGAPDAS